MRKEVKYALQDDVVAPAHYRICSKCGKKMESGYKFYEDYFCEDCRQEEFSDEEWKEAYEDAGGSDPQNTDVFWVEKF